MIINIPKHHINILAFLMDSIKNGRTIMTPNVFSIDNFSKLTVNVETRETVGELYQSIEKGESVYVNFSTTGLDNEIHCINGETYYLSDTDEQDKQLLRRANNLKMSNQERSGSKVRLGNDNSVGYLINKPNESIITIQTAIISLRKMNITPIKDAGIFEQPMITYIQSFISQPVFQTR